MITIGGIKECTTTCCSKLGHQQISFIGYLSKKGGYFISQNAVECMWNIFWRFHTDTRKSLRKVWRTRLQKPWVKPTDKNLKKCMESYLPKNKRRLATQLVCLKAHFKIREVKTQWVIFQHRHFLEMGMTSLLTTTKERWHVLVSIGRMVRMSGNINLEISSLIPNFGKPL